MQTTLSSQIEFFIWTLIAGVSLGALYDLFRALRKMRKSGVRAIIFQDVVFLIITALVIFASAYFINDGEMRWYGIFGVICGFIIYRVTVGDAVLNALVAFTRFLIKTVLVIIKILLFPVKIIYKILKKPLNIIFWYTRRGAKRTGSAFKIGKERVLRQIKNSVKILKKKC